MWNYNLVTSEYSFEKRPLMRGRMEKIYWNGLPNQKQLDILREYYPIGESCFLLKHLWQPQKSYERKELFITDYKLGGGMVMPIISSYIENGEKLSKFFHSGFSFKIILSNFSPMEKGVAPDRIEMNKQFLRKLTLENILI